MVLYSYYYYLDIGLCGGGYWMKTLIGYGEEIGFAILQ